MKIFQLGSKYLAKLHFNAPDYDLDVFEKRGQTDPIKLYKYCAYDVYFTMLLYKKFRQELIDDPALKKVFLWLLMPASDAFEDVEINGVYVNEEKMEILREDLQSRLKDLEAELERLSPGTNWNSPKQVGAIIYGEWGITPLEYTKSGQPSTAEPVLQRLKNLHSGIAILLEYREIHKQLNNFY